MELRRLLGLLLMLTLVNLAGGGSDLVCAKHTGGHHASAKSPASATHHGETEAPEKESCDIPARSDCCAAMTSCAPSVSLAVVVNGFDAPTVHVALPSSLDEAPLTRLIPPDPPPPRV